MEVIVGTVDCPAVASEGGERLAVPNFVVHRAHDDDDLALGIEEEGSGETAIDDFEGFMHLLHSPRCEQRWDLGGLGQEHPDGGVWVFGSSCGDEAE